MNHSEHPEDGCIRQGRVNDCALAAGRRGGGLGARRAGPAGDWAPAGGY